MTATADVIVVGGGVTGCAVAYELARRSVDVLLLDKSLPGRATSASAGGLWPLGEAVGLGCGVIFHAGEAGHDAEKLDEVVMLPEVFREFLARSNDLFPELNEELTELSEFDMEYEQGDGLLFLIYQEAERRFVQRVGRALTAEGQLEMLSAEEVRRLEPEVTGDMLGAARLPGEHQVNPMALAEAFKRAAMHLGARFRHDARVSELRREGDRIVGVVSDGELLSCGTVVNAAGAWAGRLAATARLHLPVHPVRGQIVLTDALPHTLNTCISTSGCYLAQKAHGEVLIGSTTEDAGFDVSVTPEAIGRLCRAAVRAVPMLRRAGVKRVWAGLRPATPDELPILGAVDGVSGYVNAAGGFRTGIVASPLTARLVAECVVDEPFEFPIEPFLAERFSRVAAAEKDLHGAT